MSKQTPMGLRARVVIPIRKLAFACVATAMCILFVASAAASAATAPPFDPTIVIADDVFRASSSMTPADIQAFLDARKGVLDVTTVARHSDGSVAPVSQVLWEVSQEFNINPKVLLVTLQKEQSLLENAAPTQYALDWALGYGCKDGLPVDQRNPVYKGLGNQIWYAARDLDAWANTTWKPGLKRTICVNCIGAPAIPATYNTEFVAQNLSTYKLYVYTPHSHGPTPDIYGGNYLFWTTYWKYFDEGPLASAAMRPVYRFFNKNNGSHFYTASEAERYAVTKNYSATYSFEGPAYSINTSNTANSVPLYRFYNKKNGSHFYTASEAERDAVITRWSATYNYEGPVYSVSMSPDNALPVYRFYNKRNGSHFYTTSATERDTVIANYGATYNFEGPAYFIGN